MLPEWSTLYALVPVFVGITDCFCVNGGFLKLTVLPGVPSGVLSVPDDASIIVFDD